MKIIFVFLILLMGCSRLTAQYPFPRDTIRSLADRFNRTKIRIGSDTLVTFKVKDGVRSKISDNIITIAASQDNKFYKITTQNIPTGNDNVTTVHALIDFDDLHLIQIKLEAKTDSGYAEFRDRHVTGWSRLPKENLKTIDFQSNDEPFLNDGNTPWFAGLFPMEKNKIVVVPEFVLFTNTIKYVEYTAIKQETIETEYGGFECWKLNAGHVGPPGYTSYHWYEKNTGRLIRYELSKPGESLKFVTELKNIIK